MGISYGSFNMTTPIFPTLQLSPGSSSGSPTGSSAGSSAPKLLAPGPLTSPLPGPLPGPLTSPLTGPSARPRPFRDRQILCLDHGPQRLYAELVDIIDERGLAWVKPLWLVHGPEDRPELNLPAPNLPDLDLPWADELKQTLGPIDDLRGDSDLLWPVELFRAALDMELLPLLGGPLEGSRKDGPSPEAQRFRQFIRSVWEQHRSLFKGR
jgi:hypothetical protein